MLKMKFSRLFQLISKMNSSLDTQSRFDQFLNVVVMISISTITTQVEIDAENTKYMYGLRSKELSFEFFSLEIQYHSHFLVKPPLLFLPWPPTKKNSFVKHSLFRPELDQITCSTKSYYNLQITAQKSAFFSSHVYITLISLKTSK